MLSIMTFLFIRVIYFFLFFFFNDTATPEIYTLSLHDALPISCRDQTGRAGNDRHRQQRHRESGNSRVPIQDRKSTRLNSSHSQISYAVFCLKKKKKKKRQTKQNTKIQIHHI